MTVLRGEIWLAERASRSRFGTGWNSSRVSDADERHQSLYDNSSCDSIHDQLTSRFSAVLRSGGGGRRRFGERIGGVMSSVASAGQNQTNEKVGRSQRRNA